MINENKKILVTWVARNNDPYERDARNGEVADDGLVNKIYGPTLAILFHHDSFLREKITDIIMLCRTSTRSTKRKEDSDSAVYCQLHDVIKSKSQNKIDVHKPICWENDDPTDHEALFLFLKKCLPKIREKYADAEIYLHLSPGTPQMHAIMLLMATSGFVVPALRMVKTYRSTDGRNGTERFKEVHLDISPFYQSYRNSRPHLLASKDSGINLDPSDFYESKMKSLYQQASKTARFKSPILIIGEDGTGKNELASWIRIKSDYYKDKNNLSWPAVECGGYSSFDSFFKVLQGDKAKGFKGILTMAEGETLLLDEIQLLSHEAQRWLVQLLERPKFRLIATSSLSESKLRTNLLEPLYQRFARTFTIPPLREVKDDIRTYWKAIFKDSVVKYVDECNQKSVVKDEHAYHSRIIPLLEKHDLPGNLHDLKKVAESLVLSLADSNYNSVRDINEVCRQAVSVLANALFEENSICDISNAIAQAFASGNQLEDYYPVEECVKGNKQLEIKGFEKQLKKFVADEIWQLHKKYNHKIEALCDVDRKTILDWRKLDRE